MNYSQSQIKHYMDDQIHQMEEGLDNLRERDFQPDGMGDLYNGMLKHTVSFEIQHMRTILRCRIPLCDHKLLLVYPSYDKNRIR